MIQTDLIETIGSCLHEVTLTRGLPLSLFTVGLVGGFMHCTTMCGPFVLSQTGHLQKPSQAMLIPYHLGRITTYTLLAVLLSSVLNLAFLFLPIRAFIIAPILMTAGLIFFINAFPSLGKIMPWLVDLRFSMPYSIISRGFSKLSGSNNFVKKYLTGVLLGFMPCGMVVSALMAASTAPNTGQAALAMMAFGAGTMPALMATAFGAELFKTRYPVAMRRVTQGMMVWSGLWLFAMAGFLLI